MNTRFAIIFAVLILNPALAPAVAHAQSALWDSGTDLLDEGRLLATGGVSEVEGAGGGGLTNWATITGYGSRDGIGVNAHYTYVHLPDYELSSYGAAAGFFDRVEISYAHQSFDTEHVGATLGLGQGYTFDQNIYGAKVRLSGNVVYDQDTWIPQLSAGVQFKNNDRGAVIHAVGGGAADGTDFYVAATKLFLAESTLVDVTLRETKANQFGILGFGGDKDNNYSTQVEGSAAYLISRYFAVGGEYRTKPDNLGIAHENNAWDLFAAWFVNKHLSVTAAYVDLGNIVIKDHQHGLYVSLQGGL